MRDNAVKIFVVVVFLTDLSVILLSISYFFPAASTCREYEFECKNGECLPIHSQCNGFLQCSEGEDEVGCGGYLGK